jgi:proton-translocating NADH-quinone oxidoreductase chain N
MNANNTLLWMIALPLMAFPVVYLAGRLATRLSPKPAPLARWLSILTLLATFIPLTLAGQALQAGQALEYKFGMINLRLDGVGMVMAVVVLLTGTLVAIFSTQYMAGEEGEEKYYALLTAMIGAIIGLGCAADLFNLWVWFETMAVTSFMLVAFYRTQAASLEAGVKYLVQSAAGSVLVLIGISLVFGQTGKLDLVEIPLAIQNSVSSASPALMFAGALFLVGFGVKTALVPLHTWLPDAHSQAPSGISAMLSGVVIEAGLIALLRAMGTLDAVSSMWGTLLLIAGAFNMLVGNLMALRQTEVKRLLAYSSVSHIGYMLVGLGVAVGFNQVNGAAGAFFHLFNHAIMKGLAFLSAGALLYCLYITQQKHGPLVVSDLNGAARRYPLVAFTLSVAVLGLGGLPPLAGFMSKWQIFTAGFQTQNTAVILLVIFAALNSVLSLGYYAPLVNRMYRYQPSEAVKVGSPVPVLMQLPLFLLTLATVILGFWPTLLNWLTGPAAASLMTIFGGH